MKRQVLSRDNVNAIVQSGFVPVRLSAASNGVLMDQYGAAGSPAFVVLTPDGQQVAILAGLIPEAQFVAFLRTHGRFESPDSLTEPGKP